MIKSVIFILCITWNGYLQTGNPKVDCPIHNNSPMGQAISKGSDSDNYWHEAIIVSGPHEAELKVFQMEHDGKEVIGARLVEFNSADLTQKVTNVKRFVVTNE